MQFSMLLSRCSMIRILCRPQLSADAPLARSAGLDELAQGRLSVPTEGRQRRREGDGVGDRDARCCGLGR